MRTIQISHLNSTLQHPMLIELLKRVSTALQPTQQALGDFFEVAEKLVAEQAAEVKAMAVEEKAKTNDKEHIGSYIILRTDIRQTADGHRAFHGLHWCRLRYTNTKIVEGGKSRITRRYVPAPIPMGRGNYSYNESNLFQYAPAWQHDHVRKYEAMAAIVRASRSALSGIGIIEHNINQRLRAINKRFEQH